MHTITSLKVTMNREDATVLPQNVLSLDRVGRDPAPTPGVPRTAPCRSGRLQGMFTAMVMIGAACMPIEAAVASSRHPAHLGHRVAQKVAFKPAHRARPAHHGRTHARLHLARSAARHTGRMHAEPTALVNTAWDNPRIPAGVMDAIRSAAQESGIDPHLLAAVAWRESRFDPGARSQRSSAKGLLQFTEGTWLQAIRDYGAQHGAGAYAAAVQRQRSGALAVPDARLRSDILQRRSDPVLSAELAAEGMRLQRAAMQDRLGRSVRSADLYLLHVLGPSGSARFLSAVAQHPTASSLEVASPKVLYNAGLLARDHRPMTVANTYAAVEAMLGEQHVHSERVFAETRPGQEAAPTPIEVSQAP